MLAAGALLVLLSVQTVQGVEPDSNYYYYDYDYVTEAPSYDAETNDWVYDLLDVLDMSDVCSPSPCLNGGSCQAKSNTQYTCSCPEPYIGKRCQKVRNVCQGVKCGYGECVVNLKTPPFYECKCRPPYQGENCRTLPTSACQPNPCQNGGSCEKKSRRFRCVCLDGYGGKLCETAPNDCYEDNGETYRGVVSMTEKGEVCLNWNSNFILRNGEDPFTLYSGFDGLEFNNHCRNPDGDEKPWCFIKQKSKLHWDYCKVKKCSKDTSVPDPLPLPVTPEIVSSQFSQCGKSQPSRVSRIYGGTKSFPGAHPWQVSLQARLKGSTDDFHHLCGGILLKSCWVLTAAHCINDADEMQVILGGVDIKKQEESDQIIPVIEATVHENYRETHDALYSDIALLKLKVMDSPYCAKETRFVRTACLPDQVFPPGKECVVSGWGATETQSSSSHLLNARVFMISQTRCQAPHIYGSLLDESMLCAGVLQGGVDSCQGDSGGPLICEQNGTHYISGVVSWGAGCGKRNKPGVYANVYRFLNWIKSRIG